MAAYISVPRDLANVKTKVAFNLTKRQLICFGAAALVGVPLFFCSPGCRRQHRGDAWHDGRHASYVLSGYVPEKRSSRRKTAAVLCAGKVPAAEGTPVQNLQLLFDSDKGGDVP